MSRRILPLLFVGLAACAPSVDLAVEEQTIRDRSAHWAALDQQEDAAGVAALFVDDGSIYWEQREPVHGREAIQAHMAVSYAENPNGEGSFAPDRVDVAASGDLAVEHGAYQNPADQGRYITVHTKVDGEWKAVTDMSVSTAPDGGAPSWAVESLASWYQAYNGRDSGAIAALYTSDAGVGDVRGTSAIRTMFETDWQEADLTCQGAHDGFEIVNDVAAGWGRDFCTDSDGNPATISRWLTFHERQPDGSWLVTRDRGQVIE